MAEWSCRLVEPCIRMENPPGIQRLRHRSGRRATRLRALGFVPANMVSAGECNGGDRRAGTHEDLARDHLDAVPDGTSAPHEPRASTVKCRATPSGYTFRANLHVMMLGSLHSRPDRRPRLGSRGPVGGARPVGPMCTMSRKVSAMTPNRANTSLKSLSTRPGTGRQP